MIWSSVRPFLRPEGLGRAEHARAAARPRRRRPPARRPRAAARAGARSTCVMPASPAGPASSGTSAGGAEGGEQARLPRRWSPLPPSPTTIRRAPASTRRADQPGRRRTSSRPSGRRHRGPGAGRTPGRSRRTPCRRRAAPSPGTSARQRARARSRRASSPPSAVVQDVDEARPAVGHRRRRSSSSSGAWRCQPSMIARAASGAVSVPPKASGATRIFTRTRHGAGTTGRGLARPRRSARTWPDTSIARLELLRATGMTARCGCCDHEGRRRRGTRNRPVSWQRRPHEQAG